MWMRRIAFFIACISFSISSLFSQTIAETYQLGEEIYQSDNLDLAEEYFNRVAYFSEGSLKYHAYEYLGDISTAQGKFQEAISYYTFAQSQGSRAQIDVQIIFKKIRLWIAMGRYKLAYAEAFNIPDNLPHLQCRKTLYQAYALYEARKFKESKDLYLGICPEANKIQVIQYFNAAYEVYHRPVRVYQWISYILPGLGQALNGYYSDALNSFLLNGVLIGVFIYTTATVGLIEGGIAVIPWIYRYYSGGAEKARHWAVISKQEKLDALHLKIIDSIKIN